MKKIPKKNFRPMPTFLTELWRHQVLTSRQYLMTSQLRQKCRNRSEFFLWILIVKKNNRANFYENRFSRSMISEKRRIWRHVKNWWRHNSVKNVGIDLKFFLGIFIVKMNNRANFYVNRFSRNVFSKKTSDFTSLLYVMTSLRRQKCRNRSDSFAASLYCHNE